MCGMGVTSFIDRTKRPAACKLLIALSRPEPGPFTYTSSSLTPNSLAFFAAASAALPAANGVDFFEPLKPTLPVEHQQIVSPFVSVIVIRVLLNVAKIWAMPFGIFFVIFFLAFTFFCILAFVYYAGGAVAALEAFVLVTPTVFRGPLRVLAFVRVLCPLTGRFLLCLKPRYEPISTRRFM